MWVLKVAIWGLNVGDPVPAADLEFLKANAPEAIEEIKVEAHPTPTKAEDSPVKKIIKDAPKNK